MTLHGHQAAVTCVQFDQSRIISGSLDRFIKIWSINSGQVWDVLVKRLNVHHDDDCTVYQELRLD